MRTAVCKVPEGSTITVQAGERSRAFSAGDRVDLDALAMPAADGRPAVTWGDALGHHVEDHFDLETKGTRRRDPEAAAATAAHEE
jgi:hypothetical protein